MIRYHDMIPHSLFSHLIVCHIVQKSSWHAWYRLLYSHYDQPKTQQWILLIDGLGTLSSDWPARKIYYLVLSISTCNLNVANKWSYVVPNKCLMDIFICVVDINIFCILHDHLSEIETNRSSVIYIYQWISDWCEQQQVYKSITNQDIYITRWHNSSINKR